MLICHHILRRLSWLHSICFLEEFSLSVIVNRFKWSFNQVLLLQRLPLSSSAIYAVPKKIRVFQSFTLEKLGDGEIKMVLRKENSKLKPR